MRVGIDLDGCVTDFGKEVIEFANLVDLGVKWDAGKDEPQIWQFYKSWGLTSAQFKQLCDDGVDAGYIFAGPPRPNAIETIHRIAEAGHDIIIVTDRFYGSNPQNSHRATIDFLEKHGVWYDELIFSADKTCTPTDIFVEDKLENYDALVANGTPTWLIDRPWNMDPQLGRKDDRARIDDIADFGDIVGIIDLMVATKSKTILTVV